MSRTIPMSHEHAAKIIEHFLHHGSLAGHCDVGGIVLHINSPLGAFSVRRDGGFAQFRQGARYAADGSLFIDQPNKPTYMVPHDYPRDWYEPFFVKYVPALDDPHSNLEAALNDFDKVNSCPRPDSAPGVRILLAFFTGILVTLILMGAF